MKKTFLCISILIAATSIQAQTIAIQPLAQLTYCAGESGSVTFQSTGSFNSDNVFEVQLSDSGSNFSSWTIIGRSSAPSGSIPVTFSASGRYRVRVVSTDPLVHSNDNGADIYVAALPVPNIYAHGSLEPTQDVETNQLESPLIGVQDDSIHIFDQYDDSAVRHQWSFNQDASISSSSLANPTVVWTSGGIKTGGVRTWNLEGCTDTASFSFQLRSCDPVIPADAHIVTGTESGYYNDVWVKPGGVYAGAAYSVFVESGGQLSVLSSGDWDVSHAYVKRGASIIIGSGGYLYDGVLDTGASFSDNGNVGPVVYCDSLQFDYSLVHASVVENSPPPEVTIRQSGDHLFTNANGLPITIRISNLLGAEVVSGEGSGSLDMDLSTLPAGIYFAVAQADGQQVVKKIAVMH